MKKIWFVLLAVLVLGLCGCGGGGGDDSGGDPVPQFETIATIAISQSNLTGTYTYPAGTYNLAISGDNNDLTFPDTLIFNNISISGINTTIDFSGNINQLNISGTNALIFSYGKPTTINLVSQAIIHLPVNATPTLNISTPSFSILYDLPAVP